MKKSVLNPNCTAIGKFSLIFMATMAMVFAKGHIRCSDQFFAFLGRMFFYYPHDLFGELICA
jgi:hypothetical protein